VNDSNDSEISDGPQYEPLMTIRISVWETGGMVIGRRNPKCPNIRNNLFPGPDGGESSLTLF
jgi:hypothetical protein